jgi:hypothetical protein
MNKRQLTHFEKRLLEERARAIKEISKSIRVASFASGRVV